MSIRKYLEKLTFDQLQFAVNTGSEMLEQMKGEPRVKLWMVSDRDICHHYFAHEDYQLAVQALARIAKDAEECHDDDSRCLSISTIKVRASEVQDYLEM